MSISPIKSNSDEIKAWNNPHLICHLMQLIKKLIMSLSNDTAYDKYYDIHVFEAFNHATMPAWLALAKSFYPFYRLTNQEKELIMTLEKQLGFNSCDYTSLQDVIFDLFFKKLPLVRKKYEPFINHLFKAFSKLIAVVLSTPALIDDAHQHDKKKFEASPPSISSCISPIEVILNQLINQQELDKAFVITASSLLLQSKAIKSQFEQLSLLQNLGKEQKENKRLNLKLQSIQCKLNSINTHNHQTNHEELNALTKKIINSLSTLPAYRMNTLGCFFHIKAKHYDAKELLISKLKSLMQSPGYSESDLIVALDGYYQYLRENASKRYLTQFKQLLNLSAEEHITFSCILMNEQTLNNETKSIALTAP